MPHGLYLWAMAMVAAYSFELGDDKIQVRDALLLHLKPHVVLILRRAYSLLRTDSMLKSGQNSIAAMLTVQQGLCLGGESELTR